MDKLKTITLGRLRAEVAKLDKLAADTEIFFGSGDLGFKRVQNSQYKADGKTPSLLYFEFDEVYSVTADPNDAE